MNEPHKPAAHAGVSLLSLSLTLSLALAAPVLAAPAAPKPAATASKHKMGDARNQKARLAKKAPTASTAGAGNMPAAKPAPEVAVSQPTLQPPALAPNQSRPAAAIATPDVAVAPAPAAVPTAPVAQTVNPYLAGWYRPIPVAALPAVAMGQLNYNARYVSDSVSSIPGKLADALPSIKTVHPTVGRDLVVANLKCPVEMVTGQYMLPANAMREGVNGLFSRLNDTQLLKFDIQLVCS